jgi:hypothetical protein
MIKIMTILLKKRQAVVGYHSRRSAYTEELLGRHVDIGDQ